MPPIKYFKNIKENGYKHDKNEGIQTILQANNYTIQYNGITLSKENGLIDQIKISNNFDELNKIYCFFTISERSQRNDLININNINKNKYFLLFTNLTEFFNHLDNFCLKNKLKMQRCPVEYIDKNNYEGYVGPFKKFMEYKFQNEYRILIENQDEKPLVLKIGNLSNISLIGESKDMLNHFQITEIS